MKPVSSRFLAALRGSHTARYRVRVLTTFQTGVDPEGTEVDIVTGSVTLDGTANERASLDLTLDSQAGHRWPANQFGVLTPFGNEVFVERGIAGLVTSPPPVEGGSITDLDGYRYHTFTNDGSLIVNRQVPVEYLIVGGGGGAGGSNNSIRGSGGGGAGRVIQGSGILAPGSYPIVVGSGGAGGTGLNAGTDGGDSSFNGETAPGGGGGGEADNGSGHDGRPGGSGGGAGGEIGTGGSNVAGSPSAGLGNDGGDAPGAGLGRGGGGGGGAGGVGQPGQSNLGGDGGLGIEWPPGSGDFYAGGGGGGQSGGGSGGSGVGGQGDGSNAVPNTGSGGGGIAGVGATGGDGSDGVVIIRYPVAALQVDVDDTTEWAPLGYFRIETIEQEDAPRSPIRITARDRMAAIVEARMLEPRTFPAGTTFLEVFENLVLEVYPNAVLDIDDAVASSTLREPATVEEDRYAFLRDMATSRGRVMFFDHRGVFVVAPEPDATLPVFTVNEGEDGVLVNLRRQLSRAGVYNAVVAEGTEADYDNDEPPARAVVVDDNPNSATYFFGPFGQVPRFYTSPLIFTDEQAELAAASILARTTGIPYTLWISSVPNPALEPFDPIRVIFEAGREEIHVIDSLTIPLSSDQAMTINTRSLVQFIGGDAGEGTLLSGGTETIIEDNGTFYRVHTFTSSGTLTVVRPGLVEYLVVAAGGGGGTGVGAGGGGAGGLLEGSGLFIESSQVITVGSGVAGGKGQDSSIGSLVVAEGGGVGGGGNGGNGGSGGGGGGGSTGNPGRGTVGQGNDGGAGNVSASFPGGGGGGGAGATGTNGGFSDGGDGGDGVQSEITGTPTFYAGGGGGHPGGVGGSGGGGDAEQNGAANTGGGAGGDIGGNTAGGSGIVVIRYPIQ